MHLSILPVHGPVAITLAVGLPVPEADWLLDCPLDDDEVFVVLLSLLTQPEAETTKIKIPITPKLPINFFKKKLNPLYFKIYDFM